MAARCCGAFGPLSRRRLCPDCSTMPFCRILTRPGASMLACFKCTLFLSPSSGRRQVVARIDHVVSGLHVERLFLGRHKFYHFRLWYRDELAPYIREVLLDRRSLTRPYLRRSAVERLVREHTTGACNHTTAIH